MESSKLIDYVGVDEEILWAGRPDKKCWIVKSILNKMFWCDVFWALLFGYMLCHTFDNAKEEEVYINIPLIYGLVIAGVMVYFVKLIHSLISWSKKEYIVTDKAVYILKGIFVLDCKKITIDKLKKIITAFSLIDMVFRVGTIDVDDEQIASIKEWQEVLRLITEKYNIQKK